MESGNDLEISKERKKKERKTDRKTEINLSTKDLRLLSTDGAFVPVPTCAEVLLFSPHDLLQSAHIGSMRERGEGGVE